MEATREAELALGRGRVALRTLLPYFDVDIWTLQPVWVPGYGTLGVTARRVLLVDPDLITRDKAWTPDTLAWVLAHEILHCFNRHTARIAAIPNVDRNIANIAADMEINDDLCEDKRAKWPWPPVTPSSRGYPDGEMMEDYYARLVQSRKVPPPPCGCGGAAGNPGGPPGGAGDGRDKAALEQAVDGVVGRSDAQLTADRLGTAAAIEEYAEKNPGKVPAGLVRAAKAMRLPPQVRWQDELRLGVHGAMSNRPGSRMPTFKRMNRNMAGVGYGVGRPVMAASNDTCPRVFVAIDTSGSMSGPELTAGVSELSHLLRHIRAKVTFIACDAAIHVDVKVDASTDLSKLLKGGGGTAFEPIFARALAEPKRPDLIVFFTDGMGSCPQEYPGIPTIWLLSGPQCRAPVAWGKSIYVKVKP